MSEPVTPAVGSEQRLVVLASGRGSNFRSLVDAFSRGELNGGKVVALITDRRQTGAALFAREQGIEVYEVSFRDFVEREDFHRRIAGLLTALSPDLILTLGYMRILPTQIVSRFGGRIINIHPSLLPAFPGMHAQRDAFDYGVRIAGCTVHFIDEGVDTGPIILQRALEVDAAIESADQLAAAILELEHQILPKAVDLYLRGCLRLEGRRVVIEPPIPPEPLPLQNS